MQILQFLGKFLTVFFWTVLFLPIAVILSRFLAVSMNFVKVACEFKLWGIEVFYQNLLLFYL